MSSSPLPGITGGDTGPKGRWDTPRRNFVRDTWGLPAQVPGPGEGCLVGVAAEECPRLPLLAPLGGPCDLAS